MPNNTHSEKINIRAVNTGTQLAAEFNIKNRRVLLRTSKNIIYKVSCPEVYCIKGNS